MDTTAPDSDQQPQRGSRYLLLLTGWFHDVTSGSGGPPYADLRVGVVATFRPHGGDIGWRAGMHTTFESMDPTGAAARRLQFLDRWHRFGHDLIDQIEASYRSGSALPALSLSLPAQAEPDPPRPASPAARRRRPYGRRRA